MLDLEILPKLVRLTKTTLTTFRYAIRIRGELEPGFDYRKGLKQGDTLTPMLFNLFSTGKDHMEDQNEYQ